MQRSAEVNLRKKRKSTKAGITLLEIKRLSIKEKRETLQVSWWGA